MSWEIEIIGEHKCGEKVDAIIQSEGYFEIISIERYSMLTMPDNINQYLIDNDIINIAQVMAIEVTTSSGNDNVFYVTKGETGNSVLIFDKDPNIINGAIVLIIKGFTGVSTPVKAVPIKGQVENPKD